MANICFLVVLVSSLLLTSFTVGEGYQQRSCAKKRAALRKWITDYKLDSQWLECCSPVAAVKSSLRRKAHFGSVVGSWFLAITTVPSVSKAEKGAFEMDMEYYAKSIFTRNNLNKGLDITAHRSVYKSPRTLNGPFAAKVLDAVINEISETAHISRGDLISSCGECIPAYLSYFKTFAPIVSQNLTDQYYFDMLLLIFYLEAGKSIPKSEERVKLRKRIGDAVLNILLSEDSSSAYHQLPSIILPKPSTIENAAKQMPSLCDGINSVLQIFQDTGMIASFIFDADDFSDVDYAEKSFSDVSALILTRSSS